MVLNRINIVGIQHNKLFMESKKIYEYVTVTEWLDNLEKGTRLYYDYANQGYVYHYESERSTKNSKYTVVSTTTEDYFISVDIAENGIRSGTLVVGPELGALETKCENCKCLKSI
jgi:hypothetical protein